MKKMLLLLSVFCFSFCTPKIIAKTDADKVCKDSIISLRAQNDTLMFMVVKYQEAISAQENKIADMNDSIKRLNLKPLMTSSQFIELYKFQWLVKYYNLCNKNSVYWKYYKGWSTRVFEAENKNYKPTDYVPDVTTIPEFIKMNNLK